MSKRPSTECSRAASGAWQTGDMGQLRGQLAAAPGHAPDLPHESEGLAAGAGAFSVATRRWSAASRPHICS